MLKPHHKLYAADAELIADARARRISLAMLEALEPVDEFNADEEDELIARRAVAALGPAAEYYILRTIYSDCEYWMFCSAGDLNPMVLESRLIQ